MRSCASLPFGLYVGIPTVRDLNLDTSTYPAIYRSEVDDAFLLHKPETPLVKN